MFRPITLLLILALLLSACQPGTAPTEGPAATPTLPATRILSAAQYGISSSTVLGMEDGFYSDAIQRFLEKQNSQLASYQEEVEQQTLTAAEIIWMVSQSDEYNLDPKALLTNLYMENSLTWPADQCGFYDHMQAMAQGMFESYKSYNKGGRTMRLGNGEILAVEDENGPAMFMIADYFSPSALSMDVIQQLLENWRGNYQRLFGEKAQKSPLAGIQVVPPTLEPFMRLPFNQPTGNFYLVNSFFDHELPKNFNNSLIVRFDGRRMDNGYFSTCVLAITCYSGHNALDYSTPMYTPLYAVADGKIIYRNDPNGGLMIQHNNGYISIYWHMERIDVTINQIVTESQQLGVSGNRGQSTGPHLHFGLRRASDSVDIDPYGWWSTTADPWTGSWAWKGDLIADNREAQAQLFYNKYWYRDPNGYAGESWYTMTVTTPGSSTNWAIWGTYIYRPGTYTVSAYWPVTEFNTVEANYQIWSNHNVFTSTVSQAVDGNRFVPLGTFYLDTGPSVVILKDLTKIRSQRIYFDAIQWTPIEYANPEFPYRYTFPLVVYGDLPW
jgi:murein DD-endopeptidase MepM/ murein hydrolase activator NlpD